MNVTAYLVLTQNSKGGARAARVTTRYPALDVDEAVIRLELELPDDVFEAPAFTVQVEKRQVAVAVEALDAEGAIA